MTIATKARETAVHFEAKKTGFGQAQDGWSLTLRIQDEDIPPHVRDAKKGTRYMVALVEIGDNEEPVQRPAVSQAAVEKPRPVETGSPAGADKERRAFSDMPPPQQAGMLCSDRAFQQFLRERHAPAHRWERNDVFPETVASEIVCDLVGTERKRDIRPDNAEWSALVLAYRLWLREPEFV